MFNNTILVISLPNTINEEQAIAALKKVQGVNAKQSDGLFRSKVELSQKRVGPGIQILRIQR